MTQEVMNNINNFIRSHTTSMRLPLNSLCIGRLGDHPVQLGREIRRRLLCDGILVGTWCLGGVIMIGVIRTTRRSNLTCRGDIILCSGRGAIIGIGYRRCSQISRMLRRVVRVMSNGSLLARRRVVDLNSLIKHIIWWRRRGR